MKSGDSNHVPWRIWLLGFSFFLLFSAFNPFQNYISILSENYASLSLTTLYFVYAFSCPFAPGFVGKFGAKNLLPLASLGYVSFFVSPLVGPENFLLIGGGFLGFGASLLWTSQGTFLAEQTPAHLLGRASGVFNSFVQSSKLFGNAVASFIFKSSIPIRAEIFFTLIGLLSFVSLSALSCLTKSCNTSGNASKSVLKFIRFALSKEFIPFIAIFCYAGFLRAYLVSVANPLFGKESIGFVNAVGGVVAMISGPIFGKIFDSFDDKRFVTKMSLGFAIAEIILVFFIHDPEYTTFYLPYVFIFFHNVAICAFDTSIVALLSLSFTNSKEDALGAYYFFQSLSTSLFFAVSRWESFILLQCIMLFSAMFALCVLRIFMLASPRSSPSVEMYGKKHAKE